MRNIIVLIFLVVALGTFHTAESDPVVVECENPCRVE